MSDRDVWDIKKDAQAILADAATRLCSLAETMRPISGDGYGHIYIDDDGVTMRERLLFAARLLDAMGDHLQ